MIQQALNRPLSNVYTALSNAGIPALGDTFMDVAGNHFIFLQGVASNVAGAFVTFHPLDWTVTLLATTDAAKFYPVAISQGAFLATNYGWYQIYGVSTIALVKASATKETAVYTSATAGYLGTTSTSQTQILRTLILTTQGGADGAGSVFIQYPAAV